MFGIAHRLLLPVTANALVQPPTFFMAPSLFARESRNPRFRNDRVERHRQPVVGGRELVTAAPHARVLKARAGAQFLERPGVSTLVHVTIFGAVLGAFNLNDYQPMR